MSLYPIGTFSGRYCARGQKSEGRVVTAHEFGVPKEGNGDVHKKMALFIAGDAYLMSLPKILSSYVAKELLELRPKTVIATFDGDSTNMFGQGEGTRGELIQLKRYMFNKFGEILPSIHIGHARHIGRVAVQAAHHGLSPIILPGYPDGFDPGSIQLQTRYSALWNMREAIGVPYLHLSGKF